MKNLKAERHITHFSSTLLDEGSIFIDSSKNLYVKTEIGYFRLVAGYSISGRTSGPYLYPIFRGCKPINKKKITDFNNYYASQYADFIQTGLELKNWENYVSDVPLVFGNEDQTYKLVKSDIIKV